MIDHFNDIKEFVVEYFFSRLPDGLYYHDLDHTLDVLEASQRIGSAEGLNFSDLHLLKVAALFHDVGFVDSYENNEHLGAEYAGEHLPSYGYSDLQINKIKSAILATNLHTPPKSIFEQVLCDADLDYLGRNDFNHRSQLLFQELKKWGKIKSEEEWEEVQIKFLAKDHYYTSYSKELREPEVKKRLNELL